MRFPDDVPTLTRGDVTLRAHRLDDVDALVEQCLDPMSVRWTAVPRDYTRDMGVDFVTNTVPNGWTTADERTFALETTHPDGVRRFSGSISLRDEGEGRAEIAFGSHPAVRGRGLMTTAVNLLLDYGFEECGFETVIWLANEGNFPSRRLAWRVGFTFGGTLPRWLPQRGEYLDGWAATLHKSDQRTPRNTWLQTPTILGKRIALRAVTEADTPRIVEACSDPRTRHWLAQLPHPYTEDDAAAYLLHLRLGAASGLLAQWTIVDHDTDVLAGNVGFPRMGAEHAEIGYWAHPDSRGRGLMTEAVGLLVRHAFVGWADGGMGLRRLMLRAATANAASRQVAEAQGFTQYGVERQSQQLGDGSYADIVTYDLLRDEWAP